MWKDKFSILIMVTGIIEKKRIFQNLFVFLYFFNSKAHWWKEKKLKTFLYCVKEHKILQKFKIFFTEGVFTC